MGPYMIRSHIRGAGANMEWKSTGSCYRVTSNGPGCSAQNTARAACQDTQEPAFEIIRGCVSVCCVSPGRAAPWRSVSVISDLWQSPWITGQYRHSIKTSLFLSETLKIRSVWKKRWQLLPMFHLAKLVISAVKPCRSISGVSLWGLEW